MFCFLSCYGRKISILAVLTYLYLAHWTTGIAVADGGEGEARAPLNPIFFIFMQILAKLSQTDIPDPQLNRDGRKKNSAAPQTQVGYKSKF